ncbi:MAG: type II toxin-antitoxin system PemK/MazF family toxin [Spirochaetaceae bacterium]|nr:type II toxin-antitoxin system PemK/MazF family toxin [Spirochaetaceae bacterium]
MIRQGDLYWVDLGQSSGSRPALRRPFVVIQNDLFNQSRLATVVVCALTSNLSRAEAPGNVRLPQGEGNLHRDSVVNVTQLFTVDKGELTERIGRIGGERTAEVLRGVRLVLDPRRAVDTGSRPAGPFST